MPLEVQSKLLRAIESGEIRPVGSTKVQKVDARLITAASDDLRARVKEGSFWEDLFYRLNVVIIRLPPLRERREDIPILANHFLEKMKVKYNKALEGFQPETMAYLESYPWPGNVRELENIVERMVILAPSEAKHLTSDLLPSYIQPHEFERLMIEEAQKDMTSMRAAFERFILLQALNRHNWNKSATARELGISERMVRYKIQKFGIKKG